MTLEHTVSTEKERWVIPWSSAGSSPSRSTARRRCPGVVVRGEITHAKGGGRITGAPELTLRFQTMELDGEEYTIVAQPFRVWGKSDAGKSAAQISGGAVVGAVVGAVAGNAAKGAIVGAALGTGGAVATKGGQIVLAARQRLRVRLVEPVTVTYRRAPANRHQT